MARRRKTARRTRRRQRQGRSVAALVAEFQRNKAYYSRPPPSYVMSDEQKTMWGRGKTRWESITLEDFLAENQALRATKELQTCPVPSGRFKGGDGVRYGSTGRCWPLSSIEGHRLMLRDAERKFPIGFSGFIPQ